MIKSVWFQLVNGSGVNLYRPGFVLFDDEATVAAFAMAVKSACANTLAHVDAIALVVYADPAAVKNADPEPLEYDSVIGQHGSTSCKPLIVALPPENHHQYPLAHAKRPRDETAETMSLKALWETTSEMALTTLPSSPEEVAMLLQRPLPFRMALLDPATTKKISDPQSPFIVCEPLSCVMNHYVVARDMPIDPMKSENGWQKMYDILLDITLSLCYAERLPLFSSRNRVDATGTTVNAMRPDFLLQHEGMVLLRGEEKSAKEDISVPFYELTKKMRCWNPLFYGDLPYILGYATSGPQLRVVTIDRHRAARTILEFNSIVRQDAEVLKVFYNLAFFLEKMVTLSKRKWPSVLLPYTNNVNHKRTLMLVDDAVIRTITLAQCRDRVDFDRLIAIYSALKALNDAEVANTHLATVTKLVVKSRCLRVHLAPVGFTARPDNAEQVLEWVRAMLTALVHWHGRNYCHGDLRWVNIVYVPASDSGYWVLIDMDESREPYTTTIDWNHRFHGHKLTFQHDLTQLGLLLAECPVVREDLADLQKALLQAVDMPLLTADAALAMLP